MTSEMSIFHTIADIHPESGGTSRVVVDLTDALATQSLVQPVLISQSLTGEPTVSSINPKVQSIIADVTSPNALKMGLPFRTALQKIVKGREKSLIHSHGLWLPVNHWASRVAHKRNIPIIIQPHGMLEPWAMQHRSWKKHLALWLFQQRDLETAKLFIATAKQEVESIRRLNLHQPIAIIPNGVNIPELSELAGKYQNIKTVLFLGRIHPVKGLINLVKAWAAIRPVKWQVIIAGPDEGRYQAELEQEIQRHGLTDTFNFVGSVKNEDKWNLYRSVDLFVLPSHTENFGIVVAEALASGVPVITTKGAPWAELEEHKCGWWIDIGVDPLAKALEEAMNLSSEERQAMGQRGRRLVEQNYSWDKISKEMLSVYKWVLGEGSRPECVVTD